MSAKCDICSVDGCGQPRHLVKSAHPYRSSLCFYHYTLKYFPERAESGYVKPGSVQGQGEWVAFRREHAKTPPDAAPPPVYTLAQVVEAWSPPDVRDLGTLYVTVDGRRRVLCGVRRASVEWVSVQLLGSAESVVLRANGEASK